MSYQRVSSQIGRARARTTAATVSNVDVPDTVFDDGIICLIDGEKKKDLRKWLTLQYGITPSEYRRMYNLPEGYPMTITNQSPTPRSSNVVAFEPPEVIASPRMR